MKSDVVEIKNLLFAKFSQASKMGAEAMALNRVKA